MSASARAAAGVLGMPVRRVLLVHAHPDDETLSTGATAARLAADGVEVWLLTATRGEQGELVPGTVPEGVDVVTHREGELASALAALGVAHHVWLGRPPARSPGHAPRRYADSGMVWGPDGRAAPAPDVADDALTRAPLAEVTADVAALLAAVAFDAVVSYDDGGGYGHPDHVRVHDVTLAAAGVASVPYFAVLSPADDGCSPDVPHVLAVDATDLLPRLLAARGAHASQVTVVDDGHVRHVGGQLQALFPVEYLVRLEPRPTE